MSEVRLIIRDRDRDIYDDRHGSFADRVVAALSAEPETIEELEVAVERFEAAGTSGFFRHFRHGMRDEPHDAGLVVIDLAARLVVCDSTYSSPSHDGDVSYHNGHCATVDVRYHLSDDWKIRSDSIDWDAEADRRRSTRLANPLLDARAVLYGNPLLEFVARESFEAAATVSPNGTAETLPVSDDGLDVGHAAIRQVHARWLLTPRDALRGQAPRDVLLAKHSFIDWDLQDRQLQWSFTGLCPRGLDRDSAAFRFGGFGTHEIVVYYDLLRDLICSCFAAARALLSNASSTWVTHGDFLTTEVPRLAKLRDDWLETPDPEFHGRTPQSIIDNERARIPEGMSGKDAIVDHDCPLCQMQADLPGPMFWHLDGCNIDDEFAFSFERTREEWEAKQREWEDFDRRFDAKQKECERLGVKYPGHGYADPDYVWEASFSATTTDGEPIFIRLFAIGSHLAELVVGLKEPHRDCELPAANRELIDRLSRDFGNLRDVVQSDDLATSFALVEPVLDRFRESLADVTALQPELDEKAADLQNRLRRFLERPIEADDSQDE